MAHRPFRLGLTGSIGMGKSAVAAMFGDLGVPVFDADAEVHRLQGPGGKLIGPIEARFPGTTSAKGVDRQALGARVIGNAEQMAALEAIVHPAVVASRRAFIARYRSYPVILIDIPLLLETAAQRAIDMVIVVSAPPFVQRRRVLARRDMTAAKYRRIRAIQMPDHLKRARADLIIETARPKWQTKAKIRHLLACLRAARVR